MFKPEDFKLSFSTWAAPSKTIPQLVELAKNCGFTGLELVMPGNGVQPHGHGLDANSPPARLTDARHALAGSGVDISCIATQLVFGVESSPVDELKRYVTLAEGLGCRCVSISGAPLSRQKGECAGLVDALADALADAVVFAEQSSVSILLETTGDFASTRYVREVVRQVYSEHFGVLWDVSATFRALQTIEETFDDIAGQVKHVRVADLRYTDGRMKVAPVALGEGEVPFADAIKCLAHDGFEGFLSLDIREGASEEVLTRSAKVLSKLVAEAFPAPAEAQTHK